MAAISAAQVKELRERTGLGMMECKKALVEAEGDVETAISDLRKNSGLKAAKKAGRTAAEGVVRLKVADDASVGMMVEVNSETDFVARDEGFLAFADRVLDAAYQNGETDIEKLVVDDLEKEREELVQKIGENITVRRAVCVKGEAVGGYVHSNNGMGALVVLTGGSGELARDLAMHVTAVNPRVATPDDMPEDEVEKERQVIRSQPDMEGKKPEIVEKMMTGRIQKFLKENSLVEQGFVKNPEQSVKDLLNEHGAEIISFVRYEVGEGIQKEESDFASEVAAQLGD
ncbi:translation elongation factor Ts [Salicola sp. Rm-C-2C1-2]|uniref:translation elongation factor Ts n=1 Tax=Salicola sp. Rm-C-2C1-2 TaxID=3141321 RepID=UPI0032E3A962